MARSSWRSPLVVLIAGTAVLVIGMGVRMTYGLWLIPASADLGWGLSELSFAMALQALVWGAGTPLAGAIADRYGTGRVIVFAGCTFAAGLLLMSQATTPLEATFSIGILTGLAMSASTFPIILAVISREVPDEKRRAIYLGIASAAGSSGQFLVLPVTHQVMDAHGWVTTLFFLAAICGLMVPLAAALAGRSSAATGAAAGQKLGAALREAGRHRGYVLLTGGYFVCGFQTLFIATHFPAMLRGYDVSPGMGAWAISLIGLANVFGCFFWGTMGGRARKKYLLCWLYTLRSVAMALFIVLPVSDLSVVVFAVVIGTLWLGTVPLTGAIVSQIFGLRYMATLFGFTFFSHQLGAAIGIWVGGRLFDIYGNYDVIWWIAIALGIVASMLHYPIDDTPLERTAEQPA